MRVLLLLLLVWPAWAVRHSLAAVVVDLKGPVLRRAADEPPSRQGTALHLLDPLEAGVHLIVPAGSEVEFVYAGSGQRVRLVGPAETVLAEDDAPPSPLAPRKRLDALEMGGLRCRCLAMIFTDQALPRMPLVHGFKATMRARYLALKGDRPPANRAEQTSELRVQDGFATPGWDLVPGITYLVTLGEPSGWERPYDYMVYRYRPDQLQALQEAEQLADAPGPDRPIRQLILASLERQYHLYDRALTRVPLEVREQLLQEKRSAEQELE